MVMHKFTRTLRVTVTEWNDGERKVLRDGEETVDILVDVDGLVKMLGRKAVLSKGGKACEASGNVVVKHRR